MQPNLITGPDVWMESEATRQLAMVAQLEGCVHAAGMPDLHPGRGYPIGAVVATRDVVHPHLVGGDAGCGVRVVVTSVERVSPDKLERRLRAAFEAELFDGVDPAALFDAVWRSGPRAFVDHDALHDAIPDGLRRLAALDTDPDALPASADAAPYRAGFASALGTIGGGNHFAELARVGRVLDPDAGARLGLAKDAVVAVAHSGSRGLGAALAATWATRVLRGDDRDRYLGELAGACRFARANRLVLTYRLLSALGALRDHTLRGTFDVTHNDVRREPVAGAEAWIHRKGAAPAPADALAIVLGSRGAPSWIVRGTGAEAGLRSVAHGAGRRMTRSEARDKLAHRYRRAEVVRTALGSRVICDDKPLLFEEHPDAYKAIEPVIRALELHGQATRVAALTPLLTVKL
ncbi:MAG TPA: RtcB family protein [Kofleriaceae bacterium]|nr:RtcB family protein [Kofleriaceae bacterium]